MRFSQRLAAHAMSKSGPVQVKTFDPQRLVRKVIDTARSFNANVWECNANVWEWRALQGRGLELKYAPDGVKYRNMTETVLPEELIVTLSNWRNGPSFVICYDLAQLSDLLSARRIVDHTEEMKNANAQAFVQLVIVDPKDSASPFGATTLDLENPDRLEMGVILDAIRESNGLTEEIDREKCLNALMGLPAYQAANAISEAIAATGTIDVKALTSYKKAMLGAVALEWVEPDPRGLDSVGGLERMKVWFETVRVGFDTELAAKFNLPPPKGMMLCGVPGTGKSATAKALAGHLGFALLRYTGAMSKYLGDSEAKFKAVLQATEDMAPSILFIDEAEKVFASGSGETDGGTSSRIVGEFLTWLQEKTSNVFVVMTANEPQKLRPELLRTGRINMSFFLEAPNRAERLSIFNVFCRRWPMMAALDIERLATESAGWTGAEIEGSIQEYLTSLMVSGDSVDMDGYLAVLRTTPKVAERDKERMGPVREWAASMCRPASIPDDTGPATTPVRKVGLY